MFASFCDRVIFVKDGNIEVELRKKEKQDVFCDKIMKAQKRYLEKQMNDIGKTIIMVTHDLQMASYCSRLILLKDGVILEDLKNSGGSGGVLSGDSQKDERAV